eukprot:COSAG03_NODE_21837_length_298_cov_2.150754_1_plen_56_part_10
MKLSEAPAARARARVLPNESKAPIGAPRPGRARQLPAVAREESSARLGSTDLTGAV